VPVFASADRIRYNDALRKTHYDGSVKIRQGTDTIDAANAEASMDDEHRLLEMLATGQVVLTQPDRLAKGERLLYNFKEERARLTGNPATVEDRLQQVLTSSDQLTLSLRDGRFEATDDAGGRNESELLTGLNNGEWRMREWRMENGEWRMENENGKWRNGKWRNGKWRNEKWIMDNVN
jgi:lipopolysaccharide transport protein LptA